MACFPRFFRANTKNSFTPAVDENSDTLLNTNDSPVQIGRYIRREETPLFTPKSSNLETELRFKQPQQQDQLKEKQIQQIDQDNNPYNNINNPNSNFVITNNTISNFSNNNDNNNIKINTFNINGISSANYISASKKFISNKNKNTYNNNSNSNNNNNPSNSFNHATQAHIRLKPLKVRRPTALPTDIPSPELYDEEDNKSENYHPDEEENLWNISIPHTPTTPPISITTFFIGSHEDEDGKSGSMSFDKLSIQTNGGVSAVESTDQYFSSKSQNYSNNKTRRGPPRSSTAKILDNPAENIYIPPPPPMPPQILTTAESMASLASIRSANAKRHPNGNRNNLQNGLRSDFDQSLETNPESINDKFTQILSHSTLQDLSNIDDLPESTNINGTSLNGRDSGVEDPFTTPKDSDVSDAPTTHREGLIFARTNLPVKKDIEIEYIRKDECTRDLIRNAIEKNDFLNNYMDKERKELVIDAMAPAYYDKDAFIICENDEGSEIYVSEDGYFDVIKSGKVIGSFGPATVFGELAILYNAKRFASIQAATYARVWKIDRTTFRRIMVISGSRERQENLNFLKSAPFLKDLTDTVLDKVVDLLQKKFYETNTCIVREGEVGNEFFIIRGGTVTIKKKNQDGIERTVARRKRGEYFGEQALVNADCRLASVYADAPGTEVLKLDREAFNSYLGTIPQLREKPSNADNEDVRESNRKSEFDNEFANIELKELKKVATLGSGAFGRVDLVSYGKKTFALKIIKKIDIVKQDQVDHVYSEKHVMMKCRRSPFIIELYNTYRNDKFVYFLMEVCMGGDVWTVMSQRRFFDEKTAKFLAGCVVEAFDFLHSHNIIYRDLKPENLMLSTDGYCKLVDFGFAKHIPPNQKTNTFAGTPEYVAPEIILDRGHDRAVDYWALGILIFELLVGRTPFREQNQIKIYQKILGGIDVIQMPSKIPKSAQGLIKHLCKQLPAERLGYQRKGIQDIKKHSWFDSLDWNKLRNKLISSPIKRPITSNTDVQYFGQPGADNDHDPPDETSGWDIDF